MSGPPMRVLFVDTGLGFGGGQAGLVEILKRLDASKVTAVVVSPAASAIAEKCRAAGLEWQPLPFASASLPRGGNSAPRHLGWFADVGSSLYGIVYLALLVRRLKIDLVHANTFKAALACGLACLFCRLPMVFHDRTEITHGLAGRLVEILSERIVVVSHAVAGKHSARAASKVRLVYDGVDVAHFTAGSLVTSAMTVGYLGRISWEKGLDLLVESAAEVLRRQPRARFVIGGRPFTAEDVAYFEKTKMRVSQLGLGDAFCFAGEVSDSRAFLEGASIVVMPSRREGLGIVALEAMALGRPVVAFRIGGLTEVVSECQTGFVVPREDTRGLARSIVRLIDDPITARQMGSTGRLLVLQRFSGRAMGEGIMKVYREITQERDRSRGMRS